MKKALAAIGVILVLLVVVIVGRAMMTKSRQLSSSTAPPIALDTTAVLDRFVKVLRIQTVTHQSITDDDSAAFNAMCAHLAAAYPLVQRTLLREDVERGVLYTWRGSDSARAPVLLLAHLDVVPVEAGSESSWTHPPFEAVVADSFVTGRGTLDDKSSAMAIMEAVELALRDGVRPTRTVYLAFGMDEEGGGTHGAARMAQLLSQRGVRPLFILDEGGVVIDDAPLPVTRPVALVGIAEKGSVSLSLTVHGTGGHSSMPARESTIGILARAISRLEAQPFPGSLRGPTEQLFDYVAPEMAWAPKLVVTNRWLFGPLLQRQLAAKGATNAMLRTTTAVTMIDGGTKENVLASRARAVVNFRLYPGDTPGTVISRVRTIIYDARVVVDTLPGGRAASAVSPTDSVFDMLHRSIHAVFPDAVVAPYLMMAATDTRHYASLSDHVYRFMPVRLRNADVEAIHGVNERVRVSSYLDAIRFYRELLSTAAR